jgi:hypothetical protein
LTDLASRWPQGHSPMPADEAATASVNAIPTVVEMMQACIGEIEPGHRPAEQTSQPLLQSPEAQQGAMHHLVGCDQQQAIGHTGDEDGPDRGPPPRGRRQYSQAPPSSKALSVDRRRVALALSLVVSAAPRPLTSAQRSRTRAVAASDAIVSGARNTV